MSPLEIIAIVGISLYFIFNIAAVISAFSDFQTYTGKILFTILGFFIASPVLIAMFIREDAARVYNATREEIKGRLDDRKQLHALERKLITDDLEFVDKAGNKYVLGGELKKEIGLTLNKHLTNRYERGMF